MPTLLIALLATAHAAPTCDGKAAERAVLDASPTQMADAFLALAKCDPVRARKNVARMENMMPDPTSIPTALEAMKIGLGDAIRTWIGRETPDVRSRFVAKLGEACKEQPELLTGWFEKASVDLGPTFYEERWHRGLDDCRTPGVQKLLTDALTSDAIGRSPRNRSQYFGVIEVWARNLGADAVPKLAELLGTAKDDEEATLFVSAFADAARVGSDQFDAKAAELARDAIVAAAPTLPRRALDRARDTLISLQAVDAADHLSKYAWPDRYVDGRYTWAVSLVEDATCKNGKQRAALHLGTITEAGATWRDAIEPALKQRLATAWSPDVAEKCKGTSEVTVKLSDEPTTPDALAAWQAEQRAAFEAATKDAQKATEVPHEPLAW